MRADLVVPGEEKSLSITKPFKSPVTVGKERVKVRINNFKQGGTYPLQISSKGEVEGREKEGRM